MAFTTLISTEQYRMRASAQYPGDRVKRRVREINGRRYEFTRIVWGDGSVTVRAYRGRDGNDLFREWTGCGMWTDPNYLDGWERDMSVNGGRPIRYLDGSVEVHEINRHGDKRVRSITPPSGDACF